MNRDLYELGEYTINPNKKPKEIINDNIDLFQNFNEIINGKNN